MANQTYEWDTLPVASADNGAFGRIAGRYDPKELIASGGFGSVWRAHDRLMDVDVALKVLPVGGEGDLASARREVTALRWARLPGVVSLRDEGLDGERWFIVMDLVEGSPFPGCPTPCEWSEIRPRVLALLDVLARLHFSGLVHRDLKPQNVLVDESGRPTLVDLGISAGRAGSHVEVPRFLGTPRYASPEQCRGEEVGPRSDLYSLGLMITEALSGWVPHGASTPRGTLIRRAREPSPPLRDRVPSAPESLAEVVDELLRLDPGRRPASALAVLQRLGGEPALVLSNRGEQRLSWQQLRRHFLGTDRFLHLRTDAARVLWQRTGGHPGRVERELGLWIRAGLGFLEDGRIRIDRRSIERLEDGLRLDPAPVLPPVPGDEQTVLDWVRFAFPRAVYRHVQGACGLSKARFDLALSSLTARDEVWRGARGLLFAGADMDPVPHWTDEQRREAARALAGNRARRDPERLGRLVAAGAPLESILDEARARAVRLTTSGHYRRASTLLRRSVALAASEAPNREPKLLALFAHTAIASNTAAACNDALYVVERAQGRHEGLEDLSRLLRAHRALHSGERERAEELMAQCAPFKEPPLDLAWLRLRVQAARLSGVEQTQALLEGLRPDAGSTRSQAHWLTWMGAFRYDQGRFEEAARLSTEAAAQLRYGSDRTAAEINAAGALLECANYREAERIAQVAARRARAQRRPRHEAVAVWITRAIAYRAGWPVHPRIDLVEASHGVAAYTGALFGLNEGAIAWRRDAPDLARKLALRAARSFNLAAMPRHADLARALAIAAGERTDAVPLIEAALAGSDPELDIQILGLLGYSGHLVPDAPLEAMLHRVDPLRRRRRLDVLSVVECVVPGRAIAAPRP